MGSVAEDQHGEVDAYVEVKTSRAKARICIW